MECEGTATLPTTHNFIGGGRNFGLQHEGGLTPIEGGGGVVGGGRVLYTPRLDIHKNPCLVIITIKNQVV